MKARPEGLTVVIFQRGWSANAASLPFCSVFPFSPNLYLYLLEEIAVARILDLPPGSTWDYFYERFLSDHA